MDTPKQPPLPEFILAMKKSLEAQKVLDLTQIFPEHVRSMQRKIDLLMLHRSMLLMHLKRYTEEEDWQNVIENAIGLRMIRAEINIITKLIDEEV